MFGLVYFLFVLIINPIEIIAIKFLSVPRSEINVLHSFPVSMAVTIATRSISMSQMYRMEHDPLLKSLFRDYKLGRRLQKGNQVTFYLEGSLVGKFLNCIVIQSWPMMEVS